MNEGVNEGVNEGRWDEGRQWRVLLPRVVSDTRYQVVIAPKVPNNREGLPGLQRDGASQ